MKVGLATEHYGHRLVGIIFIAASVLNTACSGLPDGVAREFRTAASVVSPPQGAVRFALIPPIHLPALPERRSRTRVWVELPKGDRIDVASDPSRDGVLSLVFPTGTVIDRVEEVARNRQWHIADIRGTTLTEAGQRFHLLRPDDGNGEPTLWGYSWPSERGELDTWVHSAIADGLAEGRGLADASEDRRLSVAAGVRERGDCIRCHLPNRPADFDPMSIVHRGTDRAGFHVPHSIFGGEAPLERYRPHDPNAPSDYLTVRCASGVAKATERDGARRWACDDGRIPVAHFDVAAGLAAGNLHAKAVCEGRRLIASYMTERARRAVAKALDECREKE